MLLERSEVSVKAGMAEEFDKVMNDRGLSILADFPGVIQVRLGRGVENPNKFMFLVEWKSLEAHSAFRESGVYRTFRQLFGPYTEGGAMEHFQMF